MKLTCPHEAQLKKAEAKNAELESSYKSILAQLRREQAVINAWHNSMPWWRVGILHRRPWRSQGPVGWVGLGSWQDAKDSFHNLWQWLTRAHDCADRRIACSCTGGFRFPTRTAPEVTDE